MRLNIVLLIVFLVGLISLVSADIISINSGGSNQIIINPETHIEGFFTSFNRVPRDPSPVLVSVDGTNESDANLNCSTLISDPDSLLIDVRVRWYNNSVLFRTSNYNNRANGSIISSILGRGNLTLGDTWYCSVRFDDGYSVTNWIDSNNLTIIDRTRPIITIISPQETNYSTLNVSFNISVVENENVSMCFYNLNGGGNISMNRFNDTHFWREPSLGPGPSDVWFYCNDTSGNWGNNFVNFSIDNEAAISILLSPKLSLYVEWNLLTLPANDLDAIGNNGPNSTSYWINISAINTLVDLYVRADGDLFTSGLDVLPLQNKNFTFSSTNPNVTGVTPITMSTSYIKIGDSLGSGSTVYLKFYLDAPAGQAAGVYLNQLDVMAVRHGQPV